MAIQLTIDGKTCQAKSGERLVDLINRAGTEIPQVCYHPQLGPIQTCDTCMVEADGKLVRACATLVAEGMKISTKSARAQAAQREAFDQILGNHMLYCTVCDNNNGNCMVHNTTKFLAVEHQKNPLQEPNLTRWIRRILFIVMIPTSAFFAAAVWKLARMSKSMRLCQSTGMILIRACCGMVARRLGSRAAFPAVIASPFVPATRSWKNPCSGTRDFLPGCRSAPWTA